MGTERRIVRIGPVREAPIACALDGDQVVNRVSEWRALLDRALGPPEPTPDGARVRLPDDPGIEAEARRLMEAESACCAFFSFSLERVEGSQEPSEGGLVLSVGAADEGRVLAGALLGLAPSD